MAAEGDYIMVNKNNIITNNIATQTGLIWNTIYHKILEGLIFGEWSLKVLLDSNILVVEHNTGAV